MIFRTAAVAASVLLIAACADNGTPGSSASDAPSQIAQDRRDAAALATGEPVQAAIYGEWEVVAAHLTYPAGRVQAFGDAQLAAMKGLRLSIDRDSAGWSGPLLASDPASYSSFQLVCATPAPSENGNSGGVVLTCADGEPFGPPGMNGEPTLQLKGDNTLIVRWFDGVTLELRRAS